MSPERNVTTKKKKSDNHQTVRTAWANCRSKWRHMLAGLCGLFFYLSGQAQCLPSTLTINTGETVNYDLYFKWGILMSRAGEATLSFENTTYKGKKALHNRLHFRTIKIFESIYKMRDTMDCYYAPNYSLLYSSKRTNENKYYLTDELTFSYLGGQTFIRSRRYTPTEVKIDTTMVVMSGCAFDMLGATFFLRTLDWKHLKRGDNFPLTVAIGKELIKISYRYHGQRIVERDNVKYRTHYFTVDIYDQAFTQTKAAAELWVGDDDNHIPVKIRSKLKIGYAEIHYKSSSKLKAPLNCRFEIKE